MRGRIICKFMALLLAFTLFGGIVAQAGIVAVYASDDQLIDEESDYNVEVIEDELEELPQLYEDEMNIRIVLSEVSRKKK